MSVLERYSRVRSGGFTAFEVEFLRDQRVARLFSELGKVASIPPSDVAAIPNIFDGLFRVAYDLRDVTPRETTLKMGYDRAFAAGKTSLGPYVGGPNFKIPAMREVRGRHQKEYKTVNDHLIVNNAAEVEGAIRASVLDPMQAFIKESARAGVKFWGVSH